MKSFCQAGSMLEIEQASSYLAEQLLQVILSLLQLQGTSRKAGFYSVLFT